MFSWFTREKNTIVVFVYFDGPQRMDENRDPGRVDTDHPRSTPWFCPVASRSSASTETRNAQPVSRVASKDSVPAVKSKVVKNTKAARLEAALSALGDQESTAKAALQESLRQAKMEAKVPASPRMSGGGNKSHQQAAICIAFVGTRQS